MNPLVLAQLIVAVLPTLESGVLETVQWLEKIRSAAKQRGEWTDQMESDYQASLLKSNLDPAYRPDPDGPSAIDG